VFRVQGSGCRVQGSGCRVQGVGFRVQGSGFGDQGAGRALDVVGDMLVETTSTVRQDLISKHL